MKTINYPVVEHLMSHKIVKTHVRDDEDSAWSICCSTCHGAFDDGEDRHEWRMYLPYGDGLVRYKNGSFKNTQCHECFVKTMVIWQRTITEEINSIPQPMRDLFKW